MKKQLIFFLFSSLLAMATIPSYCSSNQYYKPENITELRSIITNTNKPIALAGKQYSQGKQTYIENGITIDLSLLNKIVILDQENKTITVEAGATWKQIQQLIDPLDLSLQNIQSYNDFSVGGSIGVNCHGREINGSIETSIISLEVMLSDGRLVTASPHQNCELFYNVIGGYGLLGIITKATLQLDKNHLLKKEWSLIPLNRYKEHFEYCIKNNPNTTFHSGILWLTTQEPLITSTTFFATSTSQEKKHKRLRGEKKSFKKSILKALYTHIKPLQKLRFYYDILKNQKLNEPLLKNYEMSHSINTLKSYDEVASTYLLQEYFIPADAIELFIKDLINIKKLYNINIVNAALRFCPAQKNNLLAYAKQDCFACVLYCNVIPCLSIENNNKIWTQKLIDAALTYNGTYYLPYKPWATQNQFEKAYPEAKNFLKLKKIFDPLNKWQNTLYTKYMKHLE